jgi:hypothetical protein
MAGISTFTYPHDVPPLRTGKTYLLIIESMNDNQQKGFAEFSLATFKEQSDMQDKIQKLETRCITLDLSRAECAIITASLYILEGYINDGVRCLAAAQKSEKADPTLALLLGRLLAP